MSTAAYNRPLAGPCTPLPNEPLPPRIRLLLPGTPASETTSAPVGAAAAASPPPAAAAVIGATAALLFVGANGQGACMERGHLDRTEGEATRC